MRATLAKFVGAILGAGLMMSATAALACNSGCAPPAPPTRPTAPTTSSCGCETGGGGGGHHGGGSGSHSGSSASASSDVNVNVTVKSGASASSSGSSFGFSSSGASYGGGYGNWSQTPGTPQNAGGLMVETGQGSGTVDMVSEQRSVTRTLVLQASCIDDTGVPHPASQVSAERAISNEYMGEVYRCIAGTHMQVTMADFGICDDFGGAGGASRVSESETSSYSRQESHSSSAYDSGYSQGDYGQGGPCSPQALACSAGGSISHGGGYAEGGERHEEHVSNGGAHRAGCAANMDLTHVNFDGGKTMTCQKGDALWFDHGNMTCKVQIQQRQCNERSLLRRFGVGLKVLTVTRTETMQRQVARQTERSSASGMTIMTFDGGVGGFVE
jgi:hypothetical protein